MSTLDSYNLVEQLLPGMASGSDGIPKWADNYLSVAGVTPTEPITQLRAWVENNEAPMTLKAGGEYPINASSSYPINGTNVRFVDLCPYPKIQRYKGHGADSALASSWRCADDSDGWQVFSGPSGNNYSCVGGPGWYG